MTFSFAAPYEQSAVPAEAARHLLGPGSVHAGVIRGGQETSSYPETWTVSVERRTGPGETTDTTLAELGQLLHAAYREEPDVTYQLIPGIDRQPFSARPGSPIVAALLETTVTVLGAPASTRGEASWTDCALLAEAGIDTVLFGVKRRRSDSGGTPYALSRGSASERSTWTRAYRETRSSSAVKSRSIAIRQNLWDCQPGRRIDIGAHRDPVGRRAQPLEIRNAQILVRPSQQSPRRHRLGSGSGDARHRPTGPGDHDADHDPLMC